MSTKVNDQEVSLLKDQLLDVFKEQMKLRRTLMELNNSALELSLQAEKNAVIIKKYASCLNNVFIGYCYLLALHLYENRCLGLRGKQQTTSLTRQLRGRRMVV